MIPMPDLPVEDAQSQLNHLAKRFAHWRQNRPSPKARLPKELWKEAVALTLTSNLSVSRVATHLGLCATDLKKHCPDAASSLASSTGDPPVHFVDVTPTTPWPSPTVEAHLKRVDGAQLHLVFSGGASGLTDVVQAFLEPS